MASATTQTTRTLRDVVARHVGGRAEAAVAAALRKRSFTRTRVDMTRTERLPPGGGGGDGLTLVLGGALPEVEVNYTVLGDPRSQPVVFVMPSMSHSAHVTRSAADRTRDDAEPGWWERVVGHGARFGIDLDRFCVVSASPLGAPYGSSSPLSTDPRTGKPYMSDFPLITPADQARLHRRLLEHLGVRSVHALVGSSMGGMQVLEYAAQFDDYDRFVCIASTARTSPSTVALRSVQRSTVISDCNYHDGAYAQNKELAALAVARQLGVICYRSRDEFDGRFDWQADPTSLEFEIESYLAAHGRRFRYDPNCYVLLSLCMDLHDLGRGFPSLKHGLARIAPSKSAMLLAVQQDALIPAVEMEDLASLLGEQGNAVHFENLYSKFGHDAFLTDVGLFNPRLAEFLDPDAGNGVDSVRRWVASMS